MSIFNYVVKNIDENGFFTSNVLSDNLFESIPKPLGTDDAIIYTLNKPDNLEDANLLTQKFNKYLQTPSKSTKQELYNALLGTHLAAYCNPFIANFEPEDINETALDLVYDFFYNAEHREPVKFAILILGLYGMERIKKQNPQFWQDLLTISHCEEFTLAFISSCSFTNYFPNEDIWELVKCTHGWGKVFAISNFQCQNDEQRQWLLQYGPLLDIEYPPLAIKLIKEINLEEILDRELTFELYKNSVAIIGNYIFFLNKYTLPDIQEIFNLHTINLYSLVNKLLLQAQRLVVNAEDVVDIISISLSLRHMYEDQNMLQIAPNQVQDLIAQCDKIIYKKDWSIDIAEHLIENDKINYQLCDLAFGLEIDVWPKVYEYWLKHLNEHQLLPFLFSYEDERGRKVLQTIEANLNLYLADQNSLFVPLRYLQTHVGEGEKIICAALTSIFDWPRGIACTILENWEKDNITPAIHNALLQARQLSTNKIVNAHIDALLIDETDTPSPELQN